MSYNNRRGPSNARGGRPIYYPPPAPGSNRRNHSVLGYWVPLVITGTIALGGLAAWVWSERSDSDDDDYPVDKPPRPQTGVGAPYPTQGSQPYPGPPPPSSQVPPYPGSSPHAQEGVVGGEAASYYGSSSRHQDETVLHDGSQGEQSTFFGQVRGAMRRTPSPQQFFDQASRTVGAGVAAAGKALGSIMEEDKDAEQRRLGRQEERDGFSDHERWSEEADDIEKTKQTSSAVEAESERRAGSSRDKGQRSQASKRSVAVVLSADTNMDGKMDEDDVVYTEHASILSHLPQHHDPTKTDLFILIYAPGLTSLPPLTYRPQLPDMTSTLGSAYSPISTPAITPGEELTTISPRVEPQSDFQSPGRQFDALYLQALSLVSSPSQILPFTTLTGYVPILRHLAPQMVYISDMLAGDEGRDVAQLKGWVGHTILVVGDEGTGGLADTETEDEGPEALPRRRWYEHSELVGLGKEVEIVDASRVGEDWSRRVVGRE